MSSLAAVAAIDERWEKWDWWDAISDSLLPGLVISFTALMGMRRAWREEPLRSRVLGRVESIMASSQDAVASPLLFVTSRKCYAQALFRLDDPQGARQVVNDVLEVMAIQVNLEADTETQRKLEEQLDAVRTLGILLTYASD
jgi:hypothetical protein